MNEKLGAIISSLLGSKGDLTLSPDPEDDIGVGRALNTAFLIKLSGPSHKRFKKAGSFLDRMSGSSQWCYVADFYLTGIAQINKELEGICSRDPQFASRLSNLSDWMSAQSHLKITQETAEKCWSVFFPEANGILKNRKASVRSLRAKRRVALNRLNPTPIVDPAGEMIFTSNVLLTTHPATRPLEGLFISDYMKDSLAKITQEDQLYWYDHPIHVGATQEENEALYGLRGLEEALEFETEQGNMSRRSRATCVLSVSVTHKGLHEIVRHYLEEEFTKSGDLTKIDLYVLTEADTQCIIEDILVPAATHYAKGIEVKKDFGIFGVDGEYGRHYSFLKAIAAFWNVLIDSKKKATFKIDLDQVFPQKELLEETGGSAFDHFKSPLWGASACDDGGHPIELGMIAGALVNQKDIPGSIFTPDVPFPEREPSRDELFFFSLLPQALSTEAEMMTRYASDDLDGQNACIQRIHVTGGTNGILVDSLRRHRPFTPSFIGRAEDQAYIFSVLMNPGTRLAYVHKDGLIMRHDKESFAQEAIESARVGKLIGDFVRIIYFSAYARSLHEDTSKIKKIVDPFTGCFVSPIPVTVTHLRFGFMVSSFFQKGEDALGLELIKNGSNRMTQALDFVNREKGGLIQILAREKRGWDLFYDTISAIEKGLKKNDTFAKSLQKKAQSMISQCAISFGGKNFKRGFW
jgi:hypothetical protein